MKWVAYFGRTVFAWLVVVGAAYGFDRSHGALCVVCLVVVIVFGLVALVLTFETSP